MICFNKVDLQNKMQSLNEANERSLTPVCAVNVSNIFAALHAKAVTAAEKTAKGNVIENTAAQGNDPKSAQFNSAGEHMIVCRKKENGEDVDKKIALEAIREYVRVFLGESTSKKITEKDIFPLPKDGEEAQPEDPNNKPSDVGTDDAEKDTKEIKESFMPSFMAFIDNDRGIMEADEDSDAGDDSDDADMGSDSVEGENGDEVEGEDEGDEAEDEDEGDEASSAGKGTEGSEDETGDEGSDGKNKSEDKSAETAPGWYVLYGLKIKGMKETKAIDALKQFGSNFLKGFSVTMRSWLGSGGDSKITVGGVLDAKDKLMGIIKYPDDTIKLADGVTKDIQKRFPSLPHVDSMFRDNKTVISEIEKNGGENAYPEYDGKVKQKIESAPYVLYIHVEGDDPKAPLLNRKEIASIITNNIKGLIAKASNNISAEKVIYLHGKALEGRGDHYGDRQAKAKLPNNLELLEILGDKPADPKTFKSLDIFKRMSDKFKTVAKDKKQKENEDIKTLLDIWDKFYEEHQDDPKSITYGEFETFIQKYHVEYKKRFQKKTNESVSIRFCMMRNLFESFNDNDIQDIMFEDDDADKNGFGKDQIDKVAGSLQNKIADNLLKPNAKSAKVMGAGSISDSLKTHVFVGKSLDILQHISNDGFKTDTLKEPSEKYKYAVYVCMDLPKKIEGKKAVNEIEYYLDEAETKVEKYLKSNPDMTQDKALADIAKFRSDAGIAKKQSDEWISDKIKKYFEKKQNSKRGWKGTPAGEFVTDENLKPIVADLIKEYGLSIKDSQNFKATSSSDKHVYYKTDVPTDSNIFVYFLDEESKSDANDDVYFAVPKDLNKTDSLDESGIDLLEGSPVKKSDITDDIIEDMTARAKAKLADLEEKLNESFVSNTTRNMLTDLFEKPSLHEAEEEESGDDTADEGDSGYEFDKWNPDPKTISEPNIELKGKKEMVVIAQFKKKDGSSGTDSDATPEIDSGSDSSGEDGDETESSGGDDLYIVPMPNVQFEKNGDNDWNDKNND